MQRSYKNQAKNFQKNEKVQVRFLTYGKTIPYCAVQGKFCGYFIEQKNFMAWETLA